jgi:hypothetical protein
MMPVSPPRLRQSRRFASSRTGRHDTDPVTPTGRRDRGERDSAGNQYKEAMR